jgi:FlaA1/EpsC-like NDP-sugar epimerase
MSSAIKQVLPNLYMTLHHSNRIKELLESWIQNPDSTTHEETSLPDFNFSEHTILITGAAGTIGSGLTKRLINSPFKSLVLIDNAETPLYFLKKEVEMSTTENIHVVLADIRDAYAMKQLFKVHQPTIVFHTAAYKHVSMMESNPYEAIKLNILATKQLAALSIAQNAHKFIFISTDKAVNPISVMGMTKRIGELHLSYLNKTSSTKFLITRFGNIIGSNGSLLPLFNKQIKKGLPLTITSEKVTRYFIQESKACELILKIAEDDHWQHYLFTFNMGKPIKIIELAKQFLKLTGSDLASTIKIIGLKPGEKEHEVLTSENEIVEPSHIENILYVKNKNKIARDTINLELIETLLPNKKPSEIKTMLKQVLNQN